MSNSLIIKIIQSFTSRVQLKGVPKIVWFSRRLLMRNDCVYEVYKNIKLKIDNETRFHWLNVFHYDGFETVLLLEKYLSPGDVYIDIGANYGYMSINASRIVGSEGLVIAVEPEPRVLNLLKENINLNNSQVAIVQKAISDSVGDISFNVATEIGLSRLDNIKENTFGMDLKNRINIQKTTLDALTDELCPDMNVKFVKIDVEGHELNIMKGCTKVLTKGKTIFQLEINHGALLQNDLQLKDIVKYFYEFSYRVFWIHSHSADWFRLGRQPTLEEIQENDCERFIDVYADVLAIPNDYIDKN